MKKTNIFKLILMMIILALTDRTSAQVTQLHIGDTSNQLASNVLVLPDTSGMIIAGYDYHFSGGAVTNAQMILMKVNMAGTAILWQEKFGIAGTNNLIYNMILTHDGNVVIVGTLGRNSVYNNNRAAIMKFRSTDGSLLWQNNFYDVAGTVGGELFSGVTELGSAGHFALVAVGSHDSRPDASNSMVCMFRNTDGALIYNETYAIDDNSTDAFVGVCTAEDSVSTYIVGNYNSEVGGTNDGHVHKYTPGMYAPGTYVPGAFVWSKYMDYTLPGLTVTYTKTDSQVITTGTLGLSDNFLSDVYVTGGKLIIYGGSMKNYLTTYGEGESIMRMNSLTGTAPEIWQVQSSNMTFANVSKILVMSNDRVINVQAPSPTWDDPTIWLTGSQTSTVVTDISSLTTSLISTTPVRYTSATPSLHSLEGIALSGANLYMAGATNDPVSGYGNNDIYVVETPLSLPVDASLACDTSDVTGKISIPVDTLVHTMAQGTFTSAPVTVNILPTSYRIGVLCASTSVNPNPCKGGSFDSGKTTLTEIGGYGANGGCSYQCTATGSPLSGWHMVKYIWHIGSTVITDLTPSTTDIQIVNVPVSGSETVTVTYFAVDSSGDTCTTARTIVLTCTKPPCYDTSCTKLTVTSAGTSGDSCTFKACANICTSYVIVGYDWTVSTGSGIVTHYISATNDCFTFSVAPGATVTVSVVAHIVDYNYIPGQSPCCEADLSQQVTCNSNNPVNCNAAFSPQTQITGTGGNTGDKKGCNFSLTAYGITLSGWTMAGYLWYVNPGTTPMYSDYIPAPSDNETFSFPYGFTGTITVVFIAVDGKGDTCRTQQTIALNCNQGTAQEQTPNGADSREAAPKQDQTGDITVYPNPTNDIVTVTSTNGSINTIQVIDVNGQKVGNYTYNNVTSANVALTGLPPGTYMLRVNNSMSKVVTKGN